MSRTLLLAAALALGACATQEAQTASATSGDRDCFFSNNIVNHRALDDEHIRLDAGMNDYIVTVRGNANSLRFSDGLIIRSEDGRICTGNGLGVTLYVGEPLRLLYVTEIARAPEAPAAG